MVLKVFDKFVISNILRSDVGWNRFSFGTGNSTTIIQLMLGENTAQKSGNFSELDRLIQILNKIRQLKGNIHVCICTRHNADIK